MQWWKYIFQAQIYYAMERICFIRHTYIMQWYKYIFSGINILCNGTNIFIKTNINLACVADALNVLYINSLDECVGRLQRRLYKLNDNIVPYGAR